MTGASLWEPLRAANVENRRLLAENVDLRNEIARLKAKIAGLEGRLAGIRDAATIVRFDPPLRGRPIDDCSATVIPRKFPWKPSTNAETPNG